MRHQLTRKREADIRCYVLKNKPLRLECVAQPKDSAVVDSQPAAPGLQTQPGVFLQDITSHYPDMSHSRLETIPDDQILVFWAEVARFQVVPPVVSEGEPPEPWMDIRDPSSGDIVGSSRCYEDTPSNTQQHMQDFILIGSSSGLQGGEDKYVLGIDETEAGGVWSRQCAGCIGEDYWKRVERRTMLVLLR